MSNQIYKAVIARLAIIPAFLATGLALGTYLTGNKVSPRRNIRQIKEPEIKKPSEEQIKNEKPKANNPRNNRIIRFNPRELA